MPSSGSEWPVLVMRAAGSFRIDSIAHQGFNPRESVIVAGGGAAGFNILPIARELGCSTTILPKTASAMSARDLVDRLDHQLIGDGDDSESCLRNRCAPELLHKFFEHAMRGLRIEPHAAALK
jgi:hypothetical protein